jgi:ribosomal RNA methyltransferase Nop2
VSTYKCSKQVSGIHEPQGHKIQDLDLSDSEEEENSGSSSGSDDDEDEDEPVTAQNMEKRSKALEKRARREELEELNEQALLKKQEEETENAMQVDDDEETGGFKLPTAEERERESQTGMDLAVVQRRIRAVTRILNRFSKLAEPGRYVIDYRLEAVY